MSLIAIQEPVDGPQHREVTPQEGLTLFNSFLRNVTDAVIESEKLPERKFRNLVAGVSRCSDIP
jgi:hypothetical protein